MSQSKPAMGADVRVHALAPILAVDIDGTMGKYHEHFRWFAELYTQRTMPGCSQDWQWANTDDFHEVLGMELAEYRQIKLAYRQGGLKRFMPTIDDDLQYIQDLRGLGIQVWVATTRPWQRLDNIDPDTQFWLDRNLGRVDGLLYGEDKYDQLKEIAEFRGQKIIGVVDDLGANLDHAQELGMRTMVRTGPHNARWRKGSIVSYDPDDTISGAHILINKTYDIYNTTLEWKDHI